MFGTVDTGKGWKSQVCPRANGGITTCHKMRHSLSLPTVTYICMGELPHFHHSPTTSFLHSQPILLLLYLDYYCFICLVFRPYLCLLINVIACSLSFTHLMFCKYFPLTMHWLTVRVGLESYTVRNGGKEVCVRNDLICILWSILH